MLPIGKIRTCCWNMVCKCKCWVSDSNVFWIRITWFDIQWRNVSFYSHSLDKYLNVALNEIFLNNSGFPFRKSDLTLGYYARVVLKKLRTCSFTSTSLVSFLWPVKANVFMKYAKLCLESKSNNQLEAAYQQLLVCFNILYININCTYLITKTIIIELVGRY